MSTRADQWIARLTPLPGVTVDQMLEILPGVDVWERDADSILGVASTMQLDEIERRRLAQVEKACTVAEYLKR